MAASAFSFGFGSAAPETKHEGEPSAKRAHLARAPGLCVAAELPLSELKPRLQKAFVETMTYGSAQLKAYNERAVEICMQEEGVDSDGALAAAEAGNTDLIPGVYEGGLKLWEAAEDLVAYLGAASLAWEDKRVVELGCGGGYAGIFAYNGNAEHVAWQDYNADVLRHWTMLNVACNVDEDDGGVEQACSRASFYAGDWSTLGPVMRPAGAGPFDIILMAETVYSPDSYDRLRDLICQLQAGCEKATVYLASKTYYFGVGGNTRDFERVMAGVGYTSKTVWQAPEGVKREIIQFTRASLDTESTTSQ